MAFAVLVTLALATVLVACAQPDEQAGESPATSLEDETSTKAEAPAKTEPAYLEDPNLPGDVAAGLVGTEWVLVSLYGGDLLEGTNVTLNITSEDIVGFATCNQYGGNATVNGGVFEARGGGDYTAAGCGGPRGEQEEAYFRALSAPATYEVSDGWLEVRDEAGEQILVYAAKEQRDMDPAALVGTGWRLQSVNGYSPDGGFEATLTFPSEGEAQSYDGCRSYIGTYVAEGDDIFFTSTRSEDGECMKPGGFRGNPRTFWESEKDRPTTCWARGGSKSSSSGATSSSSSRFRKRKRSGTRASPECSKPSSKMGRRYRLSRGPGSR